MKKQFFKRLFCAVLAVLVLSLGQTCFAAYVERDNSMSTRRFDTEIEILKNNTYRITETIDVDFSTSRHGIYRYIPYLFDVTRQIEGEEKTDSCRVRIKDINANGEPFEYYTENGNMVIQIGDADEYVSGNKTYIISYTVENRDDGIADFDEFYWNVLPHGWQTPIESSKISVTFPEKTDLSGFEIISGFYGETETEGFDIAENGKTVIATAKNELQLGEGATAYVRLADEYFVGEEQKPVLSALMIALIVVSFAAVLILKLLFGKRKQVVPVVNFYPPENMTSADIGYILDGMTDTKDIISLIIYWADKGYLSIIEENKDVMRLTKIREIDNSAKAYEKAMFLELFKDRDSVTTEELSEKFYTAVAAAKMGVADSFNTKKEKRIFKISSQVAGIFALILSAVPMAALLFIGYNIKIVTEGVLVGAIICTIFLLGALFVLYYSQIKRNAVSKAAYTLMSALSWGAVFAILAIEAALAIIFLKMHLVAIAAAVITVVCAYISTKIRCYTAYGTQLIGEIIGFKEFINAAELPRLKALVEDDPKYFYNVLPFAYVMGLSDKWAKKFESIAVEPPEWYVGGHNSAFNTYLFMRTFNNNINTIHTNMVSVPQQQSGGKGGFSFGGGFSGGGGGGGGGGSW